MVELARGADPTTDAALPPAAAWIWSDLSDPVPQNRFTWFRRVVHLDAMPADPIVRFAADSTAALRVNGVTVRRKVTRFDEPNIRAEVIDVGRYLRPGANVVVVLHHSWGDIATFQRSAHRHSGLWLESAWVGTDADWRWLVAEEFGATEQFLGVIDRTPRLRFPIDWDVRLGPGAIDDPGFDDGDWAAVEVVDHGPWPDRVPVVETPGQREHLQRPISVLSAGAAHYAAPTAPAGERPSRLDRAVLSPDPAAVAAAAGLVTGAATRLAAAEGESRFVTVDLHRPLHGFPVIEVEVAHGTVELVLGYGEIVESAYDGTVHVRSDGWVDVDGVVGTGYADRLVVGPGRHRLELPDERTARWLTLHATFTEATEAVVHELAMISSQYPVVAVGSFSCGDEAIDQIVRLCRVHAEVTMTDAYVDTPGREDGQWIEDAHLRAQLAERWYGDTALRRLAIRTLAEGQDARGELHPFFPSNYPARPAPYDWAVQWVAMLADDHRWTADIDHLARFYPTVRKLWAAVLAHLDDDGRWRTNRVLADLRTSRLPSAEGVSGVLVPWLIMLLRRSAELALVLGERVDADRWRSAAAAMGAAFRRDLLVRDHPAGPLLVTDRWQPDASVDPGLSQAGQVGPLMADGLISPDEAELIIAAAFPAPDGSPPAALRRWNTPPWAYRVLRALVLHGHADLAVAHLKERYAPFLPGHPRNRTPAALQGTLGGPLPEYWVSRDDLGVPAGEPNPAQPVDVTGSHGWGAVPLLWLHDSLLGVEIISTGGDRLRIRPVTGGLPYVSGWTATPRGAVFVHLDPQQGVLQVVLPAGCEAEVWPPAELGGPRDPVVITGPCSWTWTD